MTFLKKYIGLLQFTPLATSTPTSCWPPHCPALEEAEGYFFIEKKCWLK